MNKKILVIIPVFNKENFLTNAIESVIQQTYKNFELVLIDDYSTDSSLEIAKSYEHLDNVTILTNPVNKGCYYTRNRGLEHFKDQEWDYFTIHDADDISDINRFEKIIDYFQNNPKVLGLKTTFVRMHHATNEVDILDGKPHIGSSEGIAFFSRKAFEVLGYYDNTRFSGDTDYLWRLMAWTSNNDLGYTTEIHKEPLYVAYLHDNNLTKIYNWHTDRPQYWQKSQQDIQEMVKSNNFYREIFE